MRNTLDKMYIVRNGNVSHASDTDGELASTHTLSFVSDTTWSHTPQISYLGKGGIQDLHTYVRRRALGSGFETCCTCLRPPSYAEHRAGSFLAFLYLCEKHDTTM